MYNSIELDISNNNRIGMICIAFRAVIPVRLPYGACRSGIDRKEGKEMSIVTFENVTRVYKTGEHELKALDDVSFKLDEGRFVVILGPSGA